MQPSCSHVCVCLITKSKGTLALLRAWEAVSGHWASVCWLVVAIQPWASSLFSRLAQVCAPYSALGVLNLKIIFQMLFAVVLLSCTEHVASRRLRGKLRVASTVRMGQGIRGNRGGLNPFWDHHGFSSVLQIHQSSFVCWPEIGNT